MTAPSIAPAACCLLPAQVNLRRGGSIKVDCLAALISSDGIPNLSASSPLSFPLPSLLPSPPFPRSPFPPTYPSSLLSLPCFRSVPLPFPFPSFTSPSLTLFSPPLAWPLISHVVPYSSSDMSRKGWRAVAMN